ncbi:hypothetical protein H310_05341 [Aphanomyces invadans]|uniref:Uncharacterized protein n=1 Tax=Aphanomyces invadans TaxID=157072 RepID=A0A024U9C9_9STRA|nr:hypothetical protein H310_05341 [Aphanomyces invadans]ETW02869.1 hypothetical protein H310_05341 [Aphanomyces invadans]|eukprot:XP_008868253.1 hypothetical protein H310_05341 [Aphanomyces invadans]
MARKDAKNSTATPTTTQSTGGSTQNDRIRVEFCAHSEYANHARDLAFTVKKAFPHMDGHIDSRIYTLPQWRALLSLVCGILPFLVMAFLLAGEHIVQVVPIPHGLEVLSCLRTYRGVTLLAAGALGGFSKYLVKTGAFEVYLNDELVFSKLKTNAWCTAKEMLDALKDKGLKQVK